MWPFKRQALLDADVMRWHVNNACWLLRNLSSTSVFANTRLVLPAPGFFVTDKLSGHALAQSIFNQVKTYAGLADWAVELVSDVDVYEHKTTELVQATARHTPLGMFMRDPDHVVRISYAPKLLKTPVNLIATLAHELAHYVIHSIEDTLPCAPEEEEFLTDQTACLLGFGVFMANCAFAFEQYRDSGSGTQGWRTQRSGYLPERDLVFDLALFLTAHGLDAATAMPHLKPHLADYLKRAMKDAAVFRDELKAAGSDVAI